MFVLKKDFCYSLSTLKLNGLQAEKLTEERIVSSSFLSSLAPNGNV